MADVSSIKLPNGTTYDIADKISGYATKSYVDTEIANLPEPMIFKGSLGTGGTITTLPTASSSNEGFVYKVITAGTYASQSAKVGDTFISDGSAWVLIPSGDEPSGTVTSIATGAGLTGGPITSSGTIAHSNSTTAKTTQAVYPITIDTEGHITGSGNAVNIPSISLNGSSTTSPSFYAPTTAGTSGYYLKSNGSGAPEWAQVSAGVSDVTVGGTSVVSSGVAVIASPVQIIRW